MTNRKTKRHYVVVLNAYNLENGKCHMGWQLCYLTRQCTLRWNPVNMKKKKNERKSARTTEMAKEEGKEKFGRLTIFFTEIDTMHIIQNQRTNLSLKETSKVGEWGSLKGINFDNIFELQFYNHLQGKPWKYKSSKQYGQIQLYFLRMEVTGSNGKRLCK